jgi:hypothetical protein
MNMPTELTTITDSKTESAVQKWAGEIVAAEKELEKFYKRGNIVTKRFLDERDTLNVSSKWFNIFYANATILQSAIYAQLPKPAVSRKYTDYNDEVGRVAALIIERAITQDLDDPTDNFDACMRNAVQDRLVPGLAAAWLRLETDTEEISIPPTPGNDALDADEEPQQIKQITDQRICVDYIFWQDFIWSPCRVWEERRWVGRKAYMTREELVERFGTSKGNACPLNYRANGKGDEQNSTPKEDILKKAIVYEIWDRTKKEVIWYSKGMQELLDTRPDPLGLKGFDPCPKPMLANTATSNTTPRPDYYMIQDQYVELDTINNRISMLIQACKVVGVYDKGQPAISRMLTEGSENELIPADNWAMFAEKGGLKGQIDWLPLESVVTAIRELNAAREVIKGQIYELTGIADIVRGASKASETLGAQQIKAQFASVRIKKLQDEVAMFASEIMRLKAEIMIKHFDPQIIIKKSNILATGNDEYIEPAMQLLSSEAEFEWRIQINADTMSQADYALEKQDRIDFITAFSGFMQQLPTVLQAVPEAAPVLVGLVKWTVAGFRGARDIEGMLDKALDGLIKNPTEAKPDPEAQKQQAEQQAEQLRQQMEQQKQQAEMAAEQQRLQMEQAAAQQEAQLKAQTAQAEQAMAQQRLQMELMAEQQRLAEQQREHAQTLAFEREMNSLKIMLAEKLGEIKLETAHAQKAKVQSDANTTNKS